MTTLGDSSKPSGGWEAYAGSSQIQQEATQLTIPEHADVTEIGAWVGGWEGTCRVYLCLWSADLELIGSLGPITVANEGAGGPAGGNVTSQTGTLSPAVRLAAGTVVYVGFDRHVDDGHQVSIGGPASPDHYHGRHGGPAAAWPGDLGHASGGLTGAARRVGSWLVYEPVAGAKVYRSGSWDDADTVQVRRSGSWQDVDAVQLRRSGSWTDSE